MYNNYSDSLKGISFRGFKAYADIFVRNSSTVKMLSIIGYDNQIRSISYLINSKKYNESIDIDVDGEYRTYYISNGFYKSKITRLENGMSRLIAYSEDDDGGGMIETFTVVENANDLIRSIYDKIYNLSDLPMIPEWDQYIFDELLDKYDLTGLDVELYGPHNEGKEYFAVSVSTHDGVLVDIISKGIKNGNISIGNNREHSEEFENISGLNDYLDLFSSEIANEIEESFVPKFKPDEEDYSLLLKEYDDRCYQEGIKLFDMQKNVIQSVSNNLDKNDVSLVIGEMGTGKYGFSSFVCYNRTIRVSNL